MILLFKLSWIILSFIGLFLLFKTVLVTTPSLDKKIKIVCEKEISDSAYYKYLGEGVFYCKTLIKLDSLYRAKAITARVRTDTRMKMKIELRPKVAEIFSSNTLEVIPNDENYEDNLTFRFDQFGRPKINYLLSDIVGIYLFFSDYDKNKVLNLKIEELSLE